MRVSRPLDDYITICRRWKEEKASPRSGSTHHGLEKEGEKKMKKITLYYTEQMLQGIAPKYKDYMTTGAETPLHFQDSVHDNK